MMFRVSREAQLNGTADFFAQRILNFGDTLSGNFLMRNSREFYDPTQGSYKGKLLSLYYQDLMSFMLNEASDSQLKKVGINKKIEDHNKSQMSFENLKWGSKDLWDGVIIEGLNTIEGTPPKRATHFVEADAVRKQMWGPDSFTHRPTPDGLAAFEKLLTYLGTSEGKDGDYVLPGTSDKIEVSQMEEAQIEYYDRAIEYLKTDDAENWLGDPLTGYAEKATIREWINILTKNGMIDPDVRDILLEKHLGTKNKFILNRIGEISIIWNHFKHNKFLIAADSFAQLLKKLFGYVFSDEVK